jgi:hypothetical protein
MLLSISQYDVAAKEVRGVFLHPEFKDATWQIGARLFEFTDDFSMMRLAHEAVRKATENDPIRSCDACTFELAWANVGEGNRRWLP